jgi:hypothetical protein
LLASALITCARVDGDAAAPLLADAPPAVGAARLALLAASFFATMLASFTRAIDAERADAA